MLGSRSVVSKRPSLGENYLGQEARRRGVLQLPRISCKSVYGSPEISHLAQMLSSSSGSVPTSMAAAAAIAAAGGLHTGGVPRCASEPQLAPPPLPMRQLAPSGGVQGSGSGSECEADSRSHFPPEWVTHSLASVLRKRLGLQLFNFDLIIPETQVRVCIMLCIG